MADNYLERKMEDLRAGRLSGGPTKRHNVKPSIKPNHGTYKGKRVVIIGGSSETGLQLVKDFRACGAFVDIVDTDWKKGSAAAQATGSKFYPTDISHPEDVEHTLNRIRADRGDIDILIRTSF